MAKREKEFGLELSQAMAEKGPLCVGIDPHPALLNAWGLSDDAVGLREFSLRVVEAMAGQVAAVKPQSAFFERHGSKGIAVLEQTLEALRQAGLLSILDVKRGDIGSTMAGYAQAYLSDESSLAADAITLSPYLGFGSLSGAIELAQQNNRGVFVLDLTSNPEGAMCNMRVALMGWLWPQTFARVLRRLTKLPLTRVNLVVLAWWWGLRLATLSLTWVLI